jgi:hypothetical protein
MKRSGGPSGKAIEEGGVIVQDRQQLEELTGAVSLGVLAQEIVLATSRVLRKEDLADRERHTLEAGQQLLERLSAEKLGVAPPAGARTMDTEETYLDAFRAARLQAPDEPAQEFLGRLAKVLSAVLAGKELTEEERGLVVRIQEFFARIGELTLARANDLFDRPRKEPFPWIRMQATSFS